MFFERLEMPNKRNGPGGQNGQGIHGERSQGLCDQQRSLNDRRYQRDHREHRDSNEHFYHRQSVPDDKRSNERHQDNYKWCTIHQINSQDSSECFVLKKQREEHQHAETKTLFPIKNKYFRYEEASNDSKSEFKLVDLVAKKQTCRKFSSLRIWNQFKNATSTFNALLNSGA